MNLDDITSRTGRAVLLIAALVASLTFMFGGPDRGRAACVGGVVSLVNWWALRFLARRIMAGGPGQGAVLGGLLAAKMAALIGVVFILIHNLALDPVGLVLGLATLFVAPLLTAVVGLGSQSESNAAHAASEER